MATVTIDVNDLPGRLPEVLALARGGTEVEVRDATGPVAKLVPVTPPPPAGRPRVLGMHPGSMAMAPDFNDPLPDEFWLGES